MADADQIAQVAELLPAEATTEGWTDEKIGVILDAGNTVNKAILRYWQSKAARTAHLVSISESGSSRDLSTIHSNATRMVSYWADKVSAEELPDLEAARRGRARIHIARRV